MSKLLVIGNGFDLSIGAKTSYANFFDSNHFFIRRNKATAWIETGWTKVKDGYYLNDDGVLDCDLNCWELLFYMESADCSYDCLNWCDIERVIYDSLVDENSEKFSWKETYKKLSKYYNMRVWNNYDRITKNSCLQHNNKKIEIMLCLLVAQDWNEFSNTETVFYRKLLNELNSFEQQFGDYIRDQTKNNNYLRNALRQMHQLIGSDHRISIDSFNYSDFSNNDIIIRHINGDCNNPIFGIDISDDKEQNYPELRCFTKTSRRIHQASNNLNRYSKWDAKEIDYVIVFGHSLNKMDYDYFNYLFTMLKFNTFDIEKMGCIEFVFHVYDSLKETEIRNQYADSIYSILNYYEGYVSKSNQHVLINLLRFSGKLIIREL